MNRYFDDLETGTVERYGRYEVTREEVIDFASRYDPQPFHLDDEAATHSIFGRIAASGWHTCGMMMRMATEHWRETGLSEASLGGAGMDELRWTYPVYPGDVLSCEAELLEKIPSRSKPDRGIVRTRVKVMNQDGIVVLSVITIGMLRRQITAPAV